MTKANSKQQTARQLTHSTERHSDEAPMVITRLDGWIGSTSFKAPAAAWIIPTRVRTAN